MVRREGKCVLSKMGATRRGVPRCSSVGEPARSSLPPLQHCRSPQSLPRLSIPVFSKRSRPSAPPAPPARGAGRAAPQGRGRGARNQRSRPPAALRSFKQGVGGRRQPTGGERLLNMQMDVQEVRSTPGASHPPCRPPAPQPLGSGRQGLVPSHWLLRGTEGQASGSLLEFGLEAPFRSQDGEHDANTLG